MSATSVPMFNAPLTARTPPHPYTRAVASAAVRVRATKKNRAYIAWVTPMSRTRPARRSNVDVSSRGRPNSFTSRAPETLKRSVIVVFISAFRAYASRVMACIRRPSHRAGRRKMGSSSSASRVICQESSSITIRMNATLMRLPMTVERTSVNASWAPRTSLFNRVTSAPVWVRVKKAIGMRCTWSNTLVRMS